MRQALSKVSPDPAAKSVQRACAQNLAGARQRAHACAGVHRHTGSTRRRAARIRRHGCRSGCAMPRSARVGTESRARSGRACSARRRARTLRRRCGSPVGRRTSTTAGRRSVVHIELTAPVLVARCAELLGRADDIGEEHRRQDTIIGCGRAVFRRSRGFARSRRRAMSNASWSPGGRVANCAFGMAAASAADASNGTIRSPGRAGTSVGNCHTD